MAQDRGHEQLGVGVLRIVEHLVGQALFDDAAGVHHQHAMRQQARDAEVVRDDDDAARPGGDEAAQQVEQPRLHRDVEAAGRLVHEDQARLRHQVARDLQALAHAAGEGAGVVDAGGVDLDARSQSMARFGADAAVVRGPTAISRSPTLAPALTPMRRPSARSWWTKPQSVRSRKRRSASAQRGCIVDAPSPRCGS
jgi:hypothetical protein